MFFCTNTYTHIHTTNDRKNKDAKRVHFSCSTMGSPQRKRMRIVWICTGHKKMEWRRPFFGLLAKRPSPFLAPTLTLSFSLTSQQLGMQVSARERDATLKREELARDWATLVQLALQWQAISVKDDWLTREGRQKEEENLCLSLLPLACTYCRCISHATWKSLVNHSFDAG